MKILPEAPLWGIEKELCRRDPDTYDYVMRPPATGVKKPSRKARPGSAAGEAKRRSFVGGDEKRRSFVGEVDGKRRSFTEPGGGLGRSATGRDKNRSSVVVEEKRKERRKDREREKEKSRPLTGGGGGGGGAMSGLGAESRLGGESRVSGVGRRSRAGSFEERSTVVREEMPHRRERGKAWWEGVRSPAPGERSPRRSSLRV